MSTTQFAKLNAESDGLDLFRAVTRAYICKSPWNDCRLGQRFDVTETHKIGTVEVVCTISILRMSTFSIGMQYNPVEFEYVQVPILKKELEDNFIIVPEGY